MDGLHDAGDAGAREERGDRELDVELVAEQRQQLRGITRDYTPFLPILQGTTLRLQGIVLPPF